MSNRHDRDRYRYGRCLAHGWRNLDRWWGLEPQDSNVNLGGWCRYRCRHLDQCQPGKPYRSVLLNPKKSIKLEFRSCRMHSQFFLFSILSCTTIIHLSGMHSWRGSLSCCIAQGTIFYHYLYLFLSHSPFSFSSIYRGCETSSASLFNFNRLKCFYWLSIIFIIIMIEFDLLVYAFSKNIIWPSQQVC